MEFYESLNQAVLAALTAAQAAAGGKRREAGGVIFRTEDGKYHFSSPSNDTGRDGQFRVRVQVPPGSTPVATYHNHPKGPHSHVFSAEDTRTAQQLGLPSYIIGEDGTTRRFDPAVHKTRRYRGASDIGEGEIVNLKESAEQVSALLGAAR